MFAKLLKYDVLSVWKYWWIMALCSLPLSAIGGVCVLIDNAAYTQYNALQEVAVLGIVLTVLGLFLLPLLTQILVFMRFYKHFFTDEGYLAFTLPVRKSTLLNAKMVTAVLFSVLSVLLLFADVFIIMAIGDADSVFNARNWSLFFRAIGDLYARLGGYGAMYTLQILLILLVYIAVSMMTFFVCITFGSIIAKKHKVITGVALYYAANTVTVFVLQFLSMSGIYNFYIMDEASRYPAVTAILFIVLGVLMTVATGLYLLELYLLDKRLNLE